MLKDVLESWDYTVLLSEDGFSCLDLARKEKPDIILLDIMLRGLSGYEVCSELKKDPCTQETAVILMTALSDVQSRIHGYGVAPTSSSRSPSTTMKSTSSSPSACSAGSATRAWSPVTPWRKR